MRLISLALAGAALAGCATAPETDPGSAEAQAKLQQLLAGRVAGEPRDCLPHWQTDRLVIIDDDTIAFEDGATVWRNELSGECSNLGSGFYTLVTESRGAVGLCRGEIAKVVDVSTGMTVGTCAIGDFVPYTRS